MHSGLYISSQTGYSTARWKIAAKWQILLDFSDKSQIWYAHQKARVWTKSTWRVTEVLFLGFICSHSSSLLSPGSSCSFSFVECLLWVFHYLMREVSLVSIFLHEVHLEWSLILFIFLSTLSDKLNLMTVRNLYIHVDSKAAPGQISLMILFPRACLGFGNTGIFVNSFLSQTHIMDVDIWSLCVIEYRGMNFIGGQAISVCSVALM